jgi:uncharacterized protein YndB with AHSA1/START domain
MTVASKSVSTAAPFVLSRTFDAPRELVWRAHTECKHLAHWWGPKGFTVRSCKIDLRPGGIFHYRLTSPEGDDLWGKFVFREIVAPERLVYIVSFSDELGGMARHPMAPEWPLQILSKVTFVEENGKTTLTVRWEPHAATEEERRAFEEGRSSMHEGWTGTLDHLDEHLATLRSGQ